MLASIDSIPACSESDEVAAIEEKEKQRLIDKEPELEIHLAFGHSSGCG